MSLPTLSSLPKPSFTTSALWVLAAALAAAIAVPRHEPFPYRYQVGSVWSYPSLKAPFDFDVLYPEEQVRAEIIRIENEITPAFALQPDVVKIQKKRLSLQLDEQLSVSRHDAQYDDLRANAGQYLAYGHDLLDRIYAHGVWEPESVRIRSNDTTVYIIKGRDERRVSISELLTPEQARFFISDTLPYSSLRQPEFLLPMLEELIVPNLQYSDSLTDAAKRRRLAAVRSTGITIRRTETIVQRGEKIDSAIQQRLDSLKRRYESPYGPAVMAGFFVLALLTFGSIMTWLRLEPTTETIADRRFALLAAMVIGALLVVRFGTFLAAPFPLLAPIWVVPTILNSRFGLRTAAVTGMAMLFMTCLAVEWSAAWMAIQLTGALLALWLYPAPGNLMGYVRLAAITSASQTLIWLACGWAEKLPDALRTFDVLIFITGGAALAALVLGLVPMPQQERK